MSGWISLAIPDDATTQYLYDDYLRPETVIYPDGESVTTAYNGLGLPTVLSSTIGVTTTTLVDAVQYDEAGRLTQMRFPAGGNLYRSLDYAPWNQQNSNGGLLAAIKVGMSAGASDKLNLAYTYDSYGNLQTLTENGVGNSFAYDPQNRLTNAYDRSYSYDPAGRLTSYEGTGYALDNTFPVHAIKNAGYSYDANGNLTTRNGQTLVWDVENRLSAVSGNGVNERYLYDPDGQRVKKTSGGVATYYVNQFYEVEVEWQRCGGD